MQRSIAISRAIQHHQHHHHRRVTSIPSLIVNHCTVIGGYYTRTSAGIIGCRPLLPLSLSPLSSLSLSSRVCKVSTSSDTCIAGVGVRSLSSSKKKQKTPQSTNQSSGSDSSSGSGSVGVKGSISHTTNVNDNDPVHSNNIPIDSNTINSNINMSAQSTTSDKVLSSQASQSSGLPKPQQTVATLASEKSSLPVSPLATSSGAIGSKESHDISQPCSSSSVHAPQPSSSSTTTSPSSQTRRSFSSTATDSDTSLSNKSQEQQSQPSQHNIPKVPTSAISSSWSTSGAPAFTSVTDASRGDSHGAQQPPAGFDTISGSRSKEMREKFGAKPSSTTSAASGTDNTGGAPHQHQQQQSQQSQQDKGTCKTGATIAAGGVAAAMAASGMSGGSPSSSGAHESIWQTSYPLSSSHLPVYNALANNITTDVVIVGAGISGLTTAYELTRRGRDVIIVDGMSCIGGGETGRTTGHLASYLDDGVAELVRRHGVEKTRAIIESHGEAIDTIEAIAKRHNINCDFTRVDGFLFGKDARVKEGQAMDDEIKREWDAIQQCKVFAQAELVERVTSIEGLNTGKAIRFPRQAQFHPTKYLYGLARVLTEQKSEESSKGSEGKIGSCRIFCSTQIIKYEGGSHAWVESAGHHKVAANHIVMATNVPLQLINLIDSVKPMRSYAIGACIPIKYAESHSALWWDTADPYHYVRIMMNDNAKSDDDRYMLIVGGEDHVVGRDDGRSANERYHALESWARARWPMMNSVNSRWSGQVEEPVDCIAYIGMNPHDHNNVYIVTGDSGEGLTHGTIAGTLLTDLITKTKNKYEAIYDPKRHISSLAAASSYIQQNVVTQFQFGRWLESSEINDIEDLRPCHGAVIREGLSPVAVYRDSNGCINKMSAVCPHLKGIVRWNNDEQSWDCPVHGSRFTATGRVIHGPAKEGLAPISCEYAIRRDNHIRVATSTGNTSDKERNHANDG